MNTNEEINIELKKILKETELKFKELSKNELNKVSGGYGMEFLIGKWIKPDESLGIPDIVYELIGCSGSDLIGNMWVRIKNDGCGYIVKCIRKKPIPLGLLMSSKEIPRPDWAHE